MPGLRQNRKPVMPRVAATPSAPGTMYSVKGVLLRRRDDLPSLRVDTTNGVAARKLFAEHELLRKPRLRVGKDGHLAVGGDRNQPGPVLQRSFGRSTGRGR